MPSPFIWPVTRTKVARVEIRIRLGGPGRTTSEGSKLKLKVGKFLATVRAAGPFFGKTIA